MQQTSNSAGGSGEHASGLAAYRGCWVALIGDQIAGVGDSDEAARLAAHHSRARERVTAVIFVPEETDS
ncbi:MAG: hypothetical protein R2844_05840 [Caldilineales bacterium]